MLLAVRTWGLPVAIMVSTKKPHVKANQSGQGGSPHSAGDDGGLTLPSHPNMRRIKSGSCWHCCCCCCCYCHSLPFLGGSVGGCVKNIKRRINIRIREHGLNFPPAIFLVSGSQTLTCFQSPGGLAETDSRDPPSDFRSRT